MAQEQQFSLTRPVQWAIGGVVGLAGLGLLSFGLLLIYADWIRGPSTEILYGILVVSLLAGGLLTLVGWRLVSGRPSPVDDWLLSASTWRMIALVFAVFAVLLLVKGRWRSGLASLAFAGLCLAGARAVAQLGPRRVQRPLP